MALFRRKDKGTPQLLKITPKGTQYYSDADESRAARSKKVQSLAIAVEIDAPEGTRHYDDGWREARAKKTQSLDLDAEVDTTPAAHGNRSGLVKCASVDPTSHEFERRVRGRRALTPEAPPTHSRTPPSSPSRSNRPRIQIVPLMEPKRPVSPTNRPRAITPPKQSAPQKPRTPPPYSGSGPSMTNHTPLETSPAGGRRARLSASKSVDVVTPAHRKVTPPPKTTPVRHVHNVQIVPLMEPKRVSPPPLYEEIVHGGNHHRPYSRQVDPGSHTPQTAQQGATPPIHARIEPLMTPKKPSPVAQPLGEAPTVVHENSHNRTPGRKNVPTSSPLGPRAVASNDQRPQRIAKGRRLMDQQGGLGPAPMSSN